MNRVAVVGGGLAGLATAHALLRVRPDLDVVVLEATDAPGGKVRTSVQDGYTFDWGPNGFLTNVPETVALAHELGLQARLRPAADAASHRFVYRDGGLRPLPTSPGTFLRSELLSLPGKLRVLSEPLLARAIRREETVFDFVAHHFGHEAARVFAGVFVAGITAGDPRELSLDALFPRLRLLEGSHGSLLRGMAAARRGERARPRGAAEPIGDGRLTSFDGGVQVLIDALVVDLGHRLRTAAPAVALRDAVGRAGGAVVELADGETLEVDAVVLATPAFAAADLLAPTAPEAAAALAAVRYADVAVVALGYDRIDVARPLDGFGFLVPRGEGVRSLGVLWSSSTFPDQAPPGKVALRAIAGGTLDPGFVALSDEEALAAVRRDLERTMGIVAEPESVRIVRWPRGIPQFTLGHRERIASAREALARRWPRLALAGNYLDGVGLNDVVRSARAAAERLAGVPRV
ncbi:MAG: protoporphyrinogen oxidase [Trueperaceae bacterium]|nr:protoporphyrinogen oxidase [Trueperaceae bacterium]